ncbi:hypothetical protein [Longimicrobium sp.]|uniref:hypothetical protein n=1 Tax=Longimicrobium sp. TaxID=2029185 RepID=UPI002E31FAE0|nr:hypothetical protein [Longimicrobium sp.]HEX6037226.1 hypothetical protein [Longimicrobium sp.]
MYTRYARRLAAFAALLALPLAAACESDPNEPEIAERLVVVVNSTENSLSLVPQEGGDVVQTRKVQLGAQGSPVGVAALGQWAVVPLGTYPFAAVVNLRTSSVTSTVALPANSGATGVDFVNDSIAVVANPGRNSVSPVNVLRGTAGAEVAVGTYPQAVVSDGARVYVINANLVNFTPAGPGSVTVLDDRLRFVQTVQLTGVNPGAAEIVGNRLYVLNSGTFGGNDGSLSVVNLQTLAEEARYTGFGDFPSSLAAAPNGELYVGIYGTGIVVWNPSTTSFRIGLNDPIEPGNQTVISGLGFDSSGRLHVTNARSCVAADPGFVYRLTSSGATDRSVQVGVCAFGLAFADVPESDD